MMKPIPHVPSARAGVSLLSVSHAMAMPLLFSRLRGANCYATASTGENSMPSSGRSSSASVKRRAVTPFNDTGQVPWSALSRTEKVGRATQQTFNFGVVVIGAALTGAIGYFLFSDVFSPNSKTAHFNRAFDRIRADPQCTAALGPADQLMAHGDETYNKWRRSRPISSTTKTDAQGHEHVMMHFYVEGPKNNGRVGVHLVKPPGREFDYKYLYLDPQGQERIYLENVDEKKQDRPGERGLSIFGIRLA